MIIGAAARFNPVLIKKRVSNIGISVQKILEKSASDNCLITEHTITIKIGTMMGSMKNFPFMLPKIKPRLAKIKEYMPRGDSLIKSRTSPTMNPIVCAFAEPRLIDEKINIIKAKSTKAGILVIRENRTL